MGRKRDRYVSGAETNKTARTSGTAGARVDILERRLFLAASPVRLTSFNSNTDGAPGNLININGEVYFEAQEDAGPALWKSDGTLAGTTQVAAFPGDNGFYDFAILNGKLLFSPDGTSSLWTSDGTSAGTFQIMAGFNLSGGVSVVNGTAYFSSVGSDGDIDLWKTNGTIVGTSIVADVGPSGGFADVSPVTLVGNMMLFAFDNGLGDNQLWKTNGTSAGTSMVADLNTILTSSQSSVSEASVDTDSLTNVNGKLLFSLFLEPLGGGGALSVQLCVSDGTMAGTQEVPNVSTYGSGGFDVMSDGIAYFGANDDELWKSDGTVAGTTLVDTINRSVTDSAPAGVSNFNGDLFFSADDGIHGQELWKSDGTATGTVMVLDINPGAKGSDPGYGTGSTNVGGFVNIGGLLYFSADDGVRGDELWKTDGTVAGTTLAADVNPGGGDSSPDELTAVGATLFLVANDGTNGPQLWSLDAGTSGPTTTVPTLTLTTDSGASNSDGVTNFAMPTFAGTADPSSTVDVQVNGSLAGSTTADSSGNWTVTLASSLADGSYSVTADEIESGSPGPVSAPLAVTIDTTAPTAALQPVAPPNAGDAAVDLTVYYSDSVGVNAATIASGSIVVTPPVGPDLAASLLSTSSIAGGVTAVYQVAAPHGTFSLADNGTYTISVQQGTVSDIAGNSVTGAVIGTFSVDIPDAAALNGTLTKIPKSVMPASRRNTTDLTLINAGSKPLNSNVPIELFASPTDSYDPSTAIPLLTVHKRLSLATGKSKALVLDFPAPATIAGGDYHLVVVANAGSPLVLNEPIVSTSETIFESPTVDLGLKFISLPKAALAAKKRVSVTIGITNSGNVTAKGNSDLQLYASADMTLDPSIDMRLAELMPHVMIAPGKSISRRLTFVTPTFMNPSQYLVANISFVGTPADNDAANNTVVSGLALMFPSSP